MFRLLLAFWALFAFAADTRPQNAPSQVDKPYVLLISMDGFRYDFASKYKAANLIEFGKKGVTAKALIPSFPTTTFPNHYSIATGLYPAHHGIVENTFWDPKRKAQFRFNDMATATDGSWWEGTPLWVLAEQQGMRAASYFWPGTDADIQHTRPSYYFRYDGKVNKDQQIAQVIAWLKLPKAERPHFITLYFSDVDHEGHEQGPDAPEVGRAVQAVDAALARLMAGIQEMGVPVDVFVVSDHGMATVDANENMTSLADFTGVQTIVSGTDLKIYSQDSAKLDSLYSQLKGKDARFAVYRQRDMPERLHYSGNDRIGDLVVIPTQPVVLHGPPRPNASPRPPNKGAHGFDVHLVPDMRGIFYAQGPHIVTGKTIDEFSNIHIFPVLCRLLGLKPPYGIDGEERVLAPILR